MASPPSSGSKPVTTSQIREKANSWNLAADVGLLTTLQAFSENVASQAGAVQQELNSLVADSATTRCQLQTVATQLMLVSSNRFVESRVYEDDAADSLLVPVTEKQTGAKLESQKDIHSRLCQALSLGGDILDRAYERLEVSDSDSDEQSGDSLPVAVEPIDPYLHRPLPYIIASRQFEDDDSVGLHLGGGLPPADTEDDLTDQEMDDEMDGAQTGDVLSDRPAAPAPAADANSAAAAVPPPDDAWSDSSDLFDPSSQMTSDSGRKESSVRTTEPPHRQRRPPGPLAGDLFPADSDSESADGDDQLFGAGPTAAPTGLWDGRRSTAAPPAHPQTMDLPVGRDQPPDDIESDGSEPADAQGPGPATDLPSPGRRLPAGAVAMFGGLDPFAAARGSDPAGPRRPGTLDSSSEDDQPSERSTAAAGQRRTAPRLHSRPINADRSTIPLSNDEDDLFAGRSAAPPTCRQPATKKTLASKPVPAPAEVQKTAAAAVPAVAKQSASLLSSSDEEDMFQAAAKASGAARTPLAKKAISGIPATTPTATIAPATAKAPVKGLFDSDSDDDIFSLVAPGRATVPGSGAKLGAAAAADVSKQADPPDNSPAAVPAGHTAAAAAAVPPPAGWPALSSTGVENVRAILDVPPGVRAPVPDAVPNAVPKNAPPAAATAPAVKPPDTGAGRGAKPPVSNLFSSSSEEDLFASVALGVKVAAATSTVASAAPAPAPAATSASAPASVPASSAASAAASGTSSRPAAKPATPPADQCKAVSAVLFDSDSDEDDLFHPAGAGAGVTAAAAPPSANETDKPVSTAHRAPTAAPTREQAADDGAKISPGTEDPRPTGHTATSPSEASTPADAAAAAARQDKTTPAAVDDSTDAGPVSSRRGGAAGAGRPLSANLSALTASIAQQLDKSAQRRSDGPAGGVALFGGAGPPPLRKQSGDEQASPPQSPVKSPMKSPAKTAADDQARPNTARHRPEQRHRARPVSMPVGRPDGVPSGVPVSLEATVAPHETLPSLTKSRARGPVKRRPSRKKAGSNRLSLPVEPSGYLPASMEPPVGLPSGSSVGSPIRSPVGSPVSLPSESPVEAPEDPSSPVIRPPVRKPQPSAGVQQLPGLLSEELRGRFARRAGSQEAADCDSDEMGGLPVVVPIASKTACGSERGVSETATVREAGGGRASLGDIPESPPTLKGSEVLASPSDVPDRTADVADFPASVPETPVVQDRTSLTSADLRAVAETPVSASPTSTAGSRSVAESVRSSSGTSDQQSPAGAVSRPAEASLTPPSAPAATVASSVAPKGRATASLFDSDSDEDLFHMPVPRPATTTAKATGGGSKSAPSAVKPLAEVDGKSSVESESVSTAAASGDARSGSGRGVRGNEIRGRSSSPVSAVKSGSAADEPPLKSGSTPTSGSSIGRDSPLVQQPPDETTTPPPRRPPPPSADLFDDSDEEDLFHAAPTARATVGTVSPTPAIPDGTPVKGDQLKIDGDGAEPRSGRTGNQEPGDDGVPAGKTGPADSEEVAPSVSADEVKPTSPSESAIPAAGSTNSLPPPGAAPVLSSAPAAAAHAVPAANLSPETRSLSAAVAKPGASVFDSDSDEDLFQTLPQPKSATKGPQDSYLKSASVNTAATNLLKGHSKGDAGNNSDKTTRKVSSPLPFEEKTEVSAVPATTAVPAQSANVNRSLFDSDGDEDLFQTVAVKSESVPTSVSAGSTGNRNVSPQHPSPPLESRGGMPGPVEQLHGNGGSVDERFRLPAELSEAGLNRAADDAVSVPASVKVRASPLAGDSLKKETQAVDAETDGAVTKKDDDATVDREETGREGVVLDAALSSNQDRMGVFSGGAVPGVSAVSVPSAVPKVFDASDTATTPAAIGDQSSRASREASSTVVSSDNTALMTVTNSAASASPASPASPDSPAFSASHASPATPASPAAAVTAKPSCGLFDSDSDEEDLFHTTNPKATVKTHVTSPKGPSSGELVSPSDVSKEPVKELIAKSEDMLANECNDANFVSPRQTKGKESTLQGTRLTVVEDVAAHTASPSHSVPSSPVSHAIPATLGASNPAAQPPKANRSLFDSESDDEDLFQSMQKSKPTPTVSASASLGSNVKKTVSSQASSKGSFVRSPSVPVSAPPANIVVSRENKQDAGSKERSKQSSDVGEVKPASALLDGSSRNVLLPRAQRKDTKPSRSLFSSDSDEEDLFSTVKSRPTSSTSSKTSSAAHQPKSAASAAVAGRSVKPAPRPSPFPTPGSPPDAPPAPTSVPTPAPASTSAAATAPSPARTAISALPPQNSDDDDDLFGSAKNAPRLAGRSAADWEKAAVAAASQTIQANRAPVKKSTATARAPESKKTASAVSKASGRAAAAPSLFSDDDDDGDLFASAKTGPLAQLPAGRAGGEDDEGAARRAAKAAAPVTGRPPPAQARATTGTAAASAVTANDHSAAESAKSQLKPAAYDPLSGLLGD